MCRAAATEGRGTNSAGLGAGRGCLHLADKCLSTAEPPWTCFFWAFVLVALLRWAHAGVLPAELPACTRGVPGALRDVWVLCNSCHWKYWCLEGQGWKTVMGRLGMLIFPFSQYRHIPWVGSFESGQQSSQFW